MIRAAAIALLVGCLPGVALAGIEEDLPVTEERSAVLCDVAGILVPENYLLIRCEKPTRDGLRFFAVQREHRRYDDILKIASDAQDNGRPIAILYLNALRHSPGGCEASN